MIRGALYVIGWTYALGQFIAATFPERLVAYAVAGAVVMAAAALVMAWRTETALRGHLQETRDAAEEVRKATAAVRRRVSRET